MPLAILAALIVSQGACDRAPSRLTAPAPSDPRLSRDSDGDTTEVVLHRGNKHYIRFRGHHFLMDEKDLGVVSDVGRERLIHLFKFPDDSMARVMARNTAVLAHVKKVRGPKQHGPYVDESELLDITPLGASYAALGRNPSVAPQLQATNGPLLARYTVLGNDYCAQSTPNAAQCYWFAVDFQNLSDRYLEMKREQNDRWAEYLNAEGLQQVLDRAAEGVDFAEAMAEAYNYYTTAVDIVNTEQLISTYNTLNTDVWVGTTLGVWAGDWSIDCSNYETWHDYPDICPEPYYEM